MRSRGRSARACAALALVFCACFALPSAAQERLGVLVVGQSNMVGGNSGPRDLLPGGQDYLGRQVFVLDRDDQVTPWHYPFPFALAGVESGTSVNVSPVVGFTKELLCRYPQHEIVIVCCARNSSAFNDFPGNPELNWAAPGSQYKLPGNLYDQTVQRIASARAQGVRFIAGVLQIGESDSSVLDATEFSCELGLLLTELRRHTGPIPWGMGSMPQWTGHPLGNLAEIDAGLVLVAQTVPGAAIAWSAGLTPDVDLAHYDTPSARVLGRRMFQALHAGNLLLDVPGFGADAPPAQPWGGPPFAGPETVLLHQDFSNGVWPSSYSQVSGGVDLGVDQLSRLDEFESFRRASGEFELSAQWGQGVTVVWRQRSNPFLVGRDQIKGFQIVSDPLGFVASGLFDGLCMTSVTGAVLSFRRNATTIDAPTAGLFLYSDYKLAMSIGFKDVVATPHGLITNSITITAR